MLKASVGAGPSGPMVVLCGEADLTCVGELTALLSSQLSGGTRELTTDVSGLRFADSASIRALALTARRLQDRGGSLLLLHPQPAVTRMLSLLGVGQLFAVLDGPKTVGGGEGG